MNFYNYVTKNYINKKIPKGDLARDMKEDKNFPKSKNSKKTIKRYLESQGACYDCLSTFDDVWEEYKSCEKKRLSKHLLKK